MRKKHYIALAASVSRALTRMAEWSEPGTGGRMVGLDVAESCILESLQEYVGEQGGDRERWRAGVIRKDKLQTAIEALARSREYQEPTSRNAESQEYCAQCGCLLRQDELIRDANGDQYHEDCFTRP